MVGRRRTALQVGSGLLVLGLLAGCGSSSAGSPGTAPAGTGAPAGAASSPAAGDTGAATPQTSSPSTPAAVTGSVDLHTWLVAVCTASEQTLSAGSLKADLSGAGTDPTKYAATLLKQFQTLGTRLRSLADQLEQIGAPDVPNGAAFTNGYIDAARTLADAYEQAIGGLSNKSTPQEVLAAFGKTAQSQKIQATVRKFESLSTLLDTTQIVDAAKSVPQCKKLDFSAAGS